MTKDKGGQKLPKYKVAEITCPKCGEHVVGDMNVISHTIVGCKKPQKKP